jgi:hypothetical protein
VAKESLATRQEHLVVSTNDAKRVVISYLLYDLPLSAGMPLEAARSLVKDAHLVEYDQSFYHSEFEAVLDALSQTSPDVEDGGLALPMWVSTAWSGCTAAMPTPP